MKYVTWNLLQNTPEDGGMGGGVSETNLIIILIIIKSGCTHFIKVNPKMNWGLW